MKFKVGDKVRILDGSGIENYSYGWYSPMIKHIGDIVTISEIRWSAKNEGYCTCLDNSFCYDVRGLELVEDAEDLTEDAEDLTEDEKNNVREAILKAAVRVIKDDDSTRKLLDDFPEMIYAFMTFTGKLTDELLGGGDE